MKFFILTASLMLVAGTAQAAKCSFTSECFESESCSETSFEMSIENGEMITDAETIPVTLGGSDTVRVYVGVTGSAFHLLTYNAEGIARYSTHLFEGPLMVNYLGGCQE